MVVALFGLLVVAAGLYGWFLNRKRAASADAIQHNISRLLLVSADAFNDRSHALYQAAIREIVNIMCNERWERAEIEWRIEQALLMVKGASSPEHYEIAKRLGQNIVRATVQSSTALPWEAQPVSGMLAWPGA